MTQHERLDTALKKNNGILRTSAVVEMGISKPVFYDYVKSKDLKQAAHGIYVSDDSWTDTLYLLHLRYGQLVFSHETALFFHDLTDREPFPYSATVKRGYNASGLKGEGVLVYTVKKELHGIGATSMKTPFGHLVPVYDMERTICDLIRSRNHIEMQTYQDALKQYARRKDKNLRNLMNYAQMFRVEKILRQYLEMLL
ncbi:MAG: type IV toxin-antitoxin system AbiEi family antitoxin domain-containing protein [Lachnospiraceae bacterium]|nr:type IV toxin-antitoxin system AbiEi family antitoxin domain-containing protein [Lachnospiraceae bacterium]